MGRARDRASADLNGQEFILDADADTSISADTDDQIDIRIAGADDFQFTANTFTAQSGSTIAAQALTATTITASGVVDITDTTDASDATGDTGALRTEGGASIAKKVYVGTDLSVAGDISFDGGNFVFNESGADKDFRIESANDVYALFMNGEKGHFGIGSNNSDYMGSNNTGGVLSLTVPSGGYSVLELAAEGADSDGALAGTFNFVNTLQTGGNLLAHIRGRTDGSTSTDRGGSLAFSTKANGGSTPTERMRMTANGRIGIGDTGQTNVKMTITENTDSDITGLKVTTGASSHDGITIWSVQGSSNASSSVLYGGYANSAHKFLVRADGDIETAGAQSLSGISDINFKENVVDANSQWDDIKALKVRNYSWKEDKLDKADKIGLIAQEVELVSPNLVFTRHKLNDVQYIKDENKKSIDEFGNEIDNPNYGKDTENPDFGKKVEGESYKTLKYSILYTKALKALQEAMTRIETLETEVKALKEA
tara:strand:+ start:70 stop:1524 length:1455 start_codon:yes stop_codon:yes gene_type:complete